jgi:hypothetical protein
VKLKPPVAKPITPRRIRRIPMMVAGFIFSENLSYGRFSLR